MTHYQPTRTRREFLRDSFCGFGSLAMASLLHQDAVRANPLAETLGRWCRMLPGCCWRRVSRGWLSSGNWENRRGII